MLREIKWKIRQCFGKNLEHFYMNMKFFKRNCTYLTRFRLKTTYSKGAFVFVIDPKYKHPGLADRLKGIIACYNLAKKNGYNFYILYKHPFCLEKYLLPNQINWIKDFDDLNYSIGNTIFYNETCWHADKPLKKGKEYHCYNYTGDLLPKVFSDTGEEWASLFNELFVPNDEIKNRISQTGFNDKSYVAVHFRFVNALENFEGNYYNALSTQEEKDNLIERCKNGLMEIKKKNPNQEILVFSDSKVFLNSIQDLPVRTLDSSSVGHISFTHSDNSVLKTFLDLFMISRASKVYVVHAPELYNSSCFALVGARIGNIDFEELNI